ncbi:hypothetical protein MMC18_004198 [Xylographa bjoerkii]|nr:hypothetical protein [Xylographa bjoerkii]
MNTTISLDPALSGCSLAPPGTRFDMGDCYLRTKACDFFPIIPFAKCEEYCGGSFGYYNPSDVFEALTAWVIPLLALLANMHFTEATVEGLEWRWASRNLNHRWLRPLWSMMKPQIPKHFVCSVQLANPISTIWSLGIKLNLGQQLWEYCNKNRLPHLDREGRRDVANLGYCLEDFGVQHFQERFNRLIQLLNNPTIIHGTGTVSDIVFECIQVTSRNLAFVRIRNTRLTIFAVLVYVGMAIVTLLTSATSSGLDYSLPHTIALRELCFFILAQVILSSAAGAWSQQQAPQSAMRAFAMRMFDIEKELNGHSWLWEDLVEKEIALWDGGSYVFRTEKFKSRRARGNGEFSYNNSSWGLLAMAWVIVIFAFAASFTISYATPTKGIGGRGLAEILYFATWVANFFIEIWMTRRVRDDDDRKRIFLRIWLKDGIISLLVLLFFFLPFIGKPYPAAVMQSITSL